MQTQTRFSGSLRSLPILTDEVGKDVGSGAKLVNLEPFITSMGLVDAAGAKDHGGTARTCILGTVCAERDPNPFPRCVVFANDFPKSFTKGAVGIVVEAKGHQEGCIVRDRRPRGNNGIHIVDGVAISGFGILSRKDPAINFDGAFVGYGVYAHTAVDEADTKRGMTDEGMLRKVWNDIACIGFQYLQNTGHVVKGVVTQLGLGTMGGDTAGVAAPANRPFMSDDDVELRWFRNNGSVGDPWEEFGTNIGKLAAEEIGKMQCSAVAMFLVNSASQNNGRSLPGFAFGKAG